jgi:GAF domain-containing protein
MDHHSILERLTGSTAVERAMLGSSATQSATASVAAGIPAPNAHLPRLVDPGPRFPGEDGGRSLAEMASSDLDAALQLLAERAQYITGASGAAIALRRGLHNDMLCRASIGSNAPELGALLSMEYGLSGESVRTRQVLRCDDAERDPRVNREGCRQLGIAAVVVMPIVSEQQVLGVFELFSGKPHVFEQRDISALQRLGEMVETAVKHAAAVQTVPAAEEPASAESQPSLDAIATETAEVLVVESAPVEPVVSAMLPDVVPAPVNPPQSELEITKTKTETETETKPEPVPKKPLFWSAATHTQASGKTDDDAASISVPLVLRNLQKCKACGFPVSQGRTFCVECEEKNWRGQRLPQPAAGSVAPLKTVVAPKPPATASVQTSLPSSAESLHLPAQSAGFGNSTLFSSSAPSRSWLASNKYVLGALLVVAIVIAAIAWLR